MTRRLLPGARPRARQAAAISFPWMWLPFHDAALTGSPTAAADVAGAINANGGTLAFPGGSLSLNGTPITEWSANRGRLTAIGVLHALPVSAALQAMCALGGLTGSIVFGWVMRAASDPPATQNVFAPLRSNDSFGGWNVSISSSRRIAIGYRPLAGGATTTLFQGPVNGALSLTDGVGDMAHLLVITPGPTPGVVTFSLWINGVFVASAPSFGTLPPVDAAAATGILANGTGGSVLGSAGAPIVIDSLLLARTPAVASGARLANLVAGHAAAPRLIPAPELLALAA